MPAQPGKIETPEGDVVGEHEGLMYHTLGQRKGLLIGGLKEYKDQPWFVVDKDVARNVLIVGQGKNHPLLFSNGLIANQLNWVDHKGPSQGRYTVKTRYRQEDVACEVFPDDEGNIKVIFDTPQRAVTPGQSAVFYDGEICLGGGIIEQYIR